MVLLSFGPFAEDMVVPLMVGASRIVSGATVYVYKSFAVDRGAHQALGGFFYGKLQGGRPGDRHVSIDLYGIVLYFDLK